MTTCRNPARQHGFTLVELLVVVSIIALLMAIMIPGMNRAINRARSVHCQSNLRQIGIAQVAYSIDHDGQYTPKFTPGGVSWQHHLVPYIPHRFRGDMNTVMNCPVAKVEAYNHSSYALNARIESTHWNFSTTAMKKPGEIILLGDVVEGNTDILFESNRNQNWGIPGFRHTGKTIANMLYCDGSVHGKDKDELAITADNNPWYWW